MAPYSISSVDPGDCILGPMVHGCASTDWSAVTSATANTALAAVLAGFMINGIVLLLSTTPAKTQRSGYVQGAGLLFTALVALGLDSYLWGLITGDTAAEACRRAWTEAMFAAGLLGIGAVGVVVAVVFLLGVFFWEASATPEPVQNGSVPDEKLRAENTAMDKSKEMLAALCTWLRPGVAVVVILLLWVSARSYLSSIFDDRPPHWATSVLTGILAVDYVVIAVFVSVYWWVSSSEAGKAAVGQAAGQESPARTPLPGWLETTQSTLTEFMGRLRILWLWKLVNWLRKILTWLPDKLLRPQRYAFVPRSRVVNGLVNLVWEGLQPDQSGETTTLNVAIFSALGYSLLSAFFTGLVVYGPTSFWNSSSAWVDFVIVGTVIWVLVVALIPLAALLAPTFGPGRAVTRSSR